jgi:hypothetical protein
MNKSTTKQENPVEDHQWPESDDLFDEYWRNGELKHFNVTHGHAPKGKVHSPEYKTWRRMRSRCLIKSTERYPRYGGRGIKICDRWMGKDGFRNFFLDVGRRPSDKHSIDRIDVNGNYEPSNCRWATIKEQSQNRTSNVFIEYKGDKYCIEEWVRRSGIPRTTFYRRYYQQKLSGDKLFRPTVHMLQDQRAELVQEWINNNRKLNWTKMEIDLGIGKKTLKKAYLDSSKNLEVPC